MGMRMRIREKEGDWNRENMRSNMRKTEFSHFS